MAGALDPFSPADSFDANVIPMASQWYYKRTVEGGEALERGPFTSREISKLAITGTLLPTDLVKRNDSRWVRAAKVHGLFRALPPTNQTDLHESIPSITDTLSPSVSESLADSLADSPSQSVSQTLSQSISFSAVTNDGSSADSPANGAGANEVDGAADSRRRLKMGSRLGNYRIVRLLGRGGVGVVLKAEHVRMKRPVALKVLRSRVMRSRRGLQRFQQEVRAAGRLSHPNIVIAYDADEVDGLHFLVMEYVDGSNLSRHLRKRGPLPLLEVLSYMQQTASGLEYAHRNGIIHRDIKPGNLLVDPEGTIKILDLGFASIQNPEGNAASAAVTQRNQLLGTFDYMAPEQADDPRSVDLRADIYSLGCTMYRLLTGELPYSGETTLHKILAHRERPIPSLRAARGDVPPELENLFTRMLAKDRVDRPVSMQVVVDELAAIIAKLQADDHSITSS